MLNAVQETIEQVKKNVAPQKKEKKAKTSKFKIAAAFGTGTALGTGVTAYVAYRLFKTIIGGWLGI